MLGGLVVLRKAYFFSAPFAGTSLSTDRVKFGSRTHHCFHI